MEENELRGHLLELVSWVEPNYIDGNIGSSHPFYNGINYRMWD